MKNNNVELLNSNKKKNHEMIIGLLFGGILGFTSNHFDNIYLKTVFFITLILGIAIFFRKYVLKPKS